LGLQGIEGPGAEGYRGMEIKVHTEGWMLRGLKGELDAGEVMRMLMSFLYAKLRSKIDCWSAMDAILIYMFKVLDIPGMQCGLLSFHI
jgi:hypothetical protein